MGAKQSKRSVDISGKEAEGAGEVAAAGAGGEGRMEPLADADALKPLPNGEAHIPEPITEKEKQLDIGTPENEKDATTEKEIKEQENDKEKEAAPLTNGDGEPKQENGESTPEDGKKPKKEKVKKKWSLRSISFSRKDKPKQDKKQKEEEPKVNGDSEIVAEEAGEVSTPETVKESPEEVKSESAETKEDKTPETPVTEPLTNGSSTPETPKVESPAIEEPAPQAEPAPTAAEPEKAETKVEPEPEKLPINGLSLEETSEPLSKLEESKPAEPALGTKETILAPEIPVKIEVCVEQKPVESLPPPLPANPPPSSAASFAASTMAPLDAALLTGALPAPVDALAVAHHYADHTPNQQIIESPPPSKVPENNEIIEITPKSEDNDKRESKDVAEQNTLDVEAVPEQRAAAPCEEQNNIILEVETKPEENIPEAVLVETTDDLSLNEISKEVPIVLESEVKVVLVDDKPQLIETVEHKSEVLDVGNESNELRAVVVEDKEPISETIVNEQTSDAAQIDELVDKVCVSVTDADTELPLVPLDDDVVQDIPPLSEVSQISIPESVDSQDTSEDLPPPPPPLDDNDLVNETVVNVHCANEITENVEAKQNDNIVTEMVTTNGVENGITNGSITEEENVKNTCKDLMGKKDVKCNGNTASEPSSPEQPLAAHLQDSLPVSDKIADLIPEVPTVPELNTETFQDTTVEVDN